MNQRPAATTEQKLQVEMLVGPGWLVEVYRLDGVALGGEETCAARRAAECAWEEGRAARQQRVLSPAERSWAFAACAEALAVLAAWWIVR